jgi:hypothetical protein
VKPPPSRYSDPEGYERSRAQQRRDVAKALAAAPDTNLEVDHAIEMLADRNVYQRSGQLVRVTREAVTEKGTTRPAGAPTIRSMPEERLAEIMATVLLNDPKGLLAKARAEYQEELAECADEDREWVHASWSEREEEARKLAAQIARRCSHTILARGEWAHVRPLDAIVSYPVMRPDGTILSARGYDEQTRTLAEISIVVDVPEQPTQDDARAALTALLTLLGDFPFASDAHRSAWVATLLTVVARPAIVDAPTPMLLIDATARGSGKGLLADVLNLITLGTRATVRTAPKTREEWDKTMLALLSAGDPVVLLDNLVGMLSSDALDTVLTGTTYGQRVLGVSENRAVPIRTVFIATANNVSLSTDLVRRSLHCRLEPPCEAPEARPASDFQHADLRGHVREHRALYLAAALTIVRAYAVAGRPRVEAKPMGSFEEWCRVVRDALVWAGGADPVETQAGLREHSDVERDELATLLREWHGLLGERAVTAAELLSAARSGRASEAQTKAAPGSMRARLLDAPSAGGRPLWDALCGIMPDGKDPTPHLVGNRLRKRRGQVVGGLAIKAGEAARNGGTYQVVRVG